MAGPIMAALPPDLVLPAGYVVRVTALDPSTGNTVSGVVLGEVAFQVRPYNSDGDGGAPSPLLVPTSELV